MKVAQVLVKYFIAKGTVVGSTCAYNCFVTKFGEAKIFGKKFIFGDVLYSMYYFSKTIVFYFFSILELFNR